MNEKPLVSLCITCYNQERYIREAVQSAFDQTYSPLEIVISDDCSTDGTVEIIEEMMRHYAGPHKVLFSENKENLYVARNYERAFKLAHGKILVTGAGDDTSMPNRVEQIVEAFCVGDKKTSCVLHGWQLMDSNGRPLGEQRRPWPIQTPLGAATAYLRDVVDKFEPLPITRDIFEDGILTLRALLLGDVVELDVPLCKWRVGTGESTQSRFREKRRKIALHHICSCQYFEKDITSCHCTIDGLSRRRAEEIKEWRLRHYTPEYNLCTGRDIRTRIRGLGNMTAENGWHDSFYMKWFVRAPLILPYGLGNVVVWLGVALRFIRTRVSWRRVK